MDCQLKNVAVPRNADMLQKTDVLNMLVTI